MCDTPLADKRELPAFEPFEGEALAGIRFAVASVAGTRDAIQRGMRERWLLRAIPRIAILATAVAEVASGDLQYGAFCFVALALTVVPAIHARRLDAGVPIEIELTLLWPMIADMTLGNSFGLYHLRWYDKALHLSSSVLVALIGFLAIYVLHLTHHTRFHAWLDGIAILLVTLGVGALWEVAEYGVDQLFARRTQGAPNLSAIDDTMFDLMLDGLGGLIGAVLGPQYIKRSRRGRALVGAFAGFIDARDRASPATTAATAARQ